MVSFTGIQEGMMTGSRLFNVEVGFGKLGRDRHGLLRGNQKGRNWLGVRNGVAFFALVANLIAIVSVAAYGQEAIYQRVEVANRVTLEIPAHWEVLDGDQRRNLAAASQLWGSNRGSTPHVAALAVNATPNPPGAIIRVSVIPAEGPTQEVLKEALLNDRGGTMKELSGVFREEFSAISGQMKKQGMSMLGQEKVEIENLGGKAAISVKYRRQHPDGGSPFQVSQYHVPLGNEKVLITLSCREATAVIYAQILEYVKQTITIK